MIESMPLLSEACDKDMVQAGSLMAVTSTRLRYTSKVNARIYV